MLVQKGENGRRIEHFGGTPHSLILSFYLPPSFSLPIPHASPHHHHHHSCYPTSLRIPQSAPRCPLTDPGLTDLPPSLCHWPPAWQVWFNAASWLAGKWQVNLQLHCDLTPGAFDVSYSTVAYGTQKWCQVSIVKKPSPWGKVQGVHYIPDLMREAMREAGGGLKKKKKGKRKKEKRMAGWFKPGVILASLHFCTFSHTCGKKHPFSNTQAERKTLRRTRWERPLEVLTLHETSDI